MTPREQYETAKSARKIVDTIMCFMVVPFGIGFGSFFSAGQSKVPFSTPIAALITGVASFLITLFLVIASNELKRLCQHLNLQMEEDELEYLRTVFGDAYLSSVFKVPQGATKLWAEGREPPYVDVVEQIAAMAAACRALNRKNNIGTAEWFSTYFDPVSKMTPVGMIQAYKLDELVQIAKKKGYIDIAPGYSPLE